mgnify:CR=1 FL=1
MPKAYQFCDAKVPCAALSCLTAAFPFEQTQQLLLATHAELVVNVADVGGDGAFGERQLFADERGGAPACEIAEDLRLPLGESVASRGLG